jgi:hypothetical protein
MPILSCYVDEETMRLLETASIEMGRSLVELAEAAIQNATIEFKVSRLGYGRSASDNGGRENG